MGVGDGDVAKRADGIGCSVFWKLLGAQIGAQMVMNCPMQATSTTLFLVNPILVTCAGPDLQPERQPGSNVVLATMMFATHAFLQNRWPHSYESVLLLDCVTECLRDMVGEVCKGVSTEESC